MALTSVDGRSQMKSLKTALAVVVWLLISEASLAAAPITPITVRVRVHDPAGLPVEGATVSLALPRYGEPRDAGSQVLTDKTGVATLTGVAQWDYSIALKKSGYYATTVPKRTVASDYEIKLYATGVQQFDLELKPVRDPIPMLLGGTGMNSMPLPSLTQPVGYDLEKGDWVAPWGKGVTADFVFQLTGPYTDRTKFDLTLTLTFPNPNDGIQFFEIPSDQTSDFAFPYEAPASGYGPSRAWHWMQTPTTIKRDFSNTVRYIFRIRTELNPDGTIKHALYGYLWRDIEFYPGKDTTGLSLNYALNPTGTPNLEIDPKKSEVLKAP